MAQEYIKIRKSPSDEWLVLPQPDSGALTYDFETTYTEDSGRTQTGAAVVSPLFTVEALGYSRAAVSKTMLSQILKIIAKGQQFQLYYFSAYYGAWCQAWFYVGKGQLNIGRLNEDKELFTSLDFNMVSVNPLT